MARQFFERSRYGWYLMSGNGQLFLTDEYARVFARAVLGLPADVESAPLAHDAIAAMEGG